MTERLLARLAEAPIPTQWGTFHAIGFETLADGVEHVALVMGDVAGASDVLVRVHSECLTGDVFGSMRCDCGPQFRGAMAAVAAEGTGIVIYSRGQEGRGIGLMRKLAAYALQDEGLDTVEANEQLGYAADARDYAEAAEILARLGVGSIRLLTNNPSKRAGLERYGVVVTGLERLQLPVTAENRGYLATKAAKMGHLIDVPEGGSDTGS